MLMWLPFMTLVRRFVKGGNGLLMGVFVRKVNIRADNKSLFCSIIYADNYYVSRRALWNNLVGHAALMRDKPWVLLGDFKAALNLEDHSCGGYEPDIAMREYKECVQQIEVMDDNAIGLHFTWNQKPKGSNGILKKIDRIMCNHPFIDDFSGSIAIFQPYRISDHSPCVLRIPKVSRPKPKPFKFSNFLIYKEGFRDVVTTGWNLNVHGCAMYRVVKRLKGLKTPLPKGFQVGKDFQYQPRAPSDGSNGGGNRGKASSKVGSSKDANVGASVTTKGNSSDRQQDKDVVDTGMMKMSILLCLTRLLLWVGMRKRKRKKKLKMFGTNP
ncbi:RNA-directed DNA polymerase, eukaryota, reverse transcriptase zinc-binding domain protein [Tanacetum coccineum]